MKKFIVMLLALAMVLSLVACGSNGSQYVEGTFLRTGTSATQNGTERNREYAKKNSPEKIYFNKNGKFEAFWSEGDSNSLTGKYELQKYEPGTIAFRVSSDEEAAAETGRIILHFDDKTFGSYTYEYVYEKYDDSDEELDLYINSYDDFWDTYYSYCYYEKR